jgi:LPPG:FO 2-phospho-L-lactate transferase
MIRAGGRAGATAVQRVELRGAEAASPPPEVLDAIGAARAVVIGPSNPVISIGPILAVRGIREALRDAPAPVVAVSPIVGGEVLKGPTAVFMRAMGVTPDTAGVAELYRGVIDGLIADEPVEGLPVLQTDVRMDGPDGRARLARETLAFAAALGA